MDSGNADGFAMNIELVQKVIAPVTGYLDGMMEIGKGVFRAEQQSAPDDGLHPNNPEAELITSYSFLCICFGHPSIIDSCLNIANLFDMPAHGLKWSPNGENGQKFGQSFCCLSQRDGKARECRAD